MLPVTTAATVRAQDAALISGLGVPGRTLMELAGRGAADAIAARWPRGQVVVLCGPGNNGGDGFVVARWLQQWGWSVTAWTAGPPRTADAEANLALARLAGVEVQDGDDPAPLLEHAAVAVDALLGTGQHQAPRGAIATAVAALDAAASKGVAVVALDQPTGVHTDTGQVLGQAVACALTVTFGRWKPGLLCAPGSALAGEVVLIDIGLDLAAQAPEAPARADAWLLEASDVAAWWPGDHPTHAKWDRGHVAVRGGGGAAVLAAHAALRCGAGLVTLLAPRVEWDRLHGLWPEILLATPDELDPRRHDALVIGPGMGLDAPDASELPSLWTTFPGAVIADADALTLLSRRELPEPGPGTGARVLTPHAAEAARLLGCNRQAVEADRLDAARTLAHLGVVVLKGPHTLIAGGALPDPPWFNPTGSVRLATGGSGDVLAGAIAALVGRGVPPRQAAAAAVYVHGLAGEAMVAGDGAGALVEGLPAAAARLPVAGR